MDNYQDVNLQDIDDSDARRWYDKDPILSKAMETLRNTDDQIQIQIALNLIKIVIEHKIEMEDFTSIEDILSSVRDASSYDSEKNSRWYDLNETVRAAIIMLQNCPDEMRSKLSNDLAKIISSVLDSEN